MQRRDFLMALASAAGGIASCLSTRSTAAEKSMLSVLPPSNLAGMILAQLRDDYRHRLFDEYLPFWEKGGCDPLPATSTSYDRKTKPRTP